MPAALVTGASRGVGRGIAIALLDAGYTVFATGRTIAHADLPRGIVRIPTDHLDDTQTSQAFERVLENGGGLDVLANVSWGGYERMVDNGVFTWGVPFWEQPLHRWTSMIGAGVRAAFVASAHAARIMVPQRRGLIVNVSFWAAQKYLGNALYGISKAATDKMTADTARDLAAHGVAVVSLYPGLVRTELVLAAAKHVPFDLSNSESPEFCGRVIAGLASHPGLMEMSGRVVVAAEFAQSAGIPDIDGRRPVRLTLQTT
jgi:NAD(P)-dependent dehydrogenase (short-subunit alcohol dehydrogenase family)